MNHRPSDVVRKLLVDMGLGFNPASPAVDWTTVAGNEPDAPDLCITVYDTQGRGQGRSMIDGEVLGHYGINFRIRSRTDREGWRKAHAISEAIAEDVYDETVSIVEGLATYAYSLHCFANIGDILPNGDEPGTKRRIHTLNCLVHIEQIPTL